MPDLLESINPESEKNKTITDAIEIANSFNEYFANIGPNLSKKIDPSVNSTTTYKSYLTDPTDFRFQSRQISELEVRSAIDNLENKTSCGCDGISNKLLKLIKNEISKPITLTFVVRLPGVPGSPRRTRRRLPGVPGSKKKKKKIFFLNV